MVVVSKSELIGVKRLLGSGLCRDLFAPAWILQEHRCNSALLVAYFKILLGGKVGGWLLMFQLKTIQREAFEWGQYSAIKWNKNKTALETLRIEYHSIYRTWKTDSYIKQKKSSFRKIGIAVYTLIILYIELEYEVMRKNFYMFFSNMAERKNYSLFSIVSSRHLLTRWETMHRTLRKIFLKSTYPPDQDFITNTCFPGYVFLKTIYPPAKVYT